MRLSLRISAVSAVGTLAIALASAQQSVPATPLRSAPQAVPAEFQFNPLPVGARAPDFSVFTPDGEKETLRQFRGKVVILDFWATWCGPCRKSMPGLEGIYQQIKNDNVVVLSVNSWDDQAKFKSFVQENSGTKYHFNFVRDPAEGDHDAIRAKSIAKKLYKAPGIPTMYLIDKNGRIAASFLGSGNEADLVKALAKLDLKATVPQRTR